MHVYIGKLGNNRASYIEQWKVWGSILRDKKRLKTWCTKVGGWLKGLPSNWTNGKASYDFAGWMAGWLAGWIKMIMLSTSSIKPWSTG